MRTECVVAAVLMATAGWAGGKTVIVAGGDCSDPTLISSAKDFRDNATRLLGSQLMEPEGVLDIVRPRPTRSVQDIERQVESAKALFYGGQGDRALELIERALIELERVPPDAKPWPVTQSALVMQALVQKSREHPKEMNDAFRRIARLDPSFKLDPDAHPPSAIAALEAIKKDLTRGRKATLQVRVDAGPAATVYVDGFAMGTTPLKLELPAGTYRVSLSAPGMVSFPHRVELPRDSKLNVDLAFEGALGLQAPLCFSSADDGAAIKLAQLVAAESVIILRNTARRSSPPFISGAVFDLTNGQQERGGSVIPELISKLATFLITGKEQEGIQLSGRQGDTQPVTVLEPARAEPPPAPKDPIVAASPAVEVTSGPPVGGQRIAAFTLIGVGGAAAVGGVIGYIAGEWERARLIGITTDMGKLPLSTLTVGAESLRLMASSDAVRSVCFGLIAAGAGAAISGLVGLWLFPASPAQLAISPAPGGAAVQVSGRF